MKEVILIGLMYYLIRAANLKEKFSKGDTTNWSYILYKIAEIINDTIPCHKIGQLPERYNIALLKKTEFTMKEIEDPMKKLNFK